MFQRIRFIILMLFAVSGFDSFRLFAEEKDSVLVVYEYDDPTIIEQNSDNFLIEYIPYLDKAPKWMQSWMNSFFRGNVDRTREKKLDLSFGISPSYTREASFGLGALCTGLYRMDRNDTLDLPSDIYACFNASLNGFYVLTIKGNNLFPDNRSRLTYRFEVYRKRLDFWGITSEETHHNVKSRYDRRQIDLQLEYNYRLTHNLFAGIHLRSDYTDARNVQNPEYLLGERRQIYVTGIGASLELDSRNSLLTPTKGAHLSYTFMAFPKKLGSAPMFFNSHKFIADYYFGAWKGSTIAMDLYAKINSNHTPWTMREMVAADGMRMRGYYMGSYIDNSQIAFQTEIRQHIWGRIGVVAWGGFATVFSSLRDLKKKEIRPEWLPNGGLGLRFEFKHNVNARIDFGIGRHTSGFVFAVGEAF
ncbi:MAG: hypothetical protein J1E38_04550 [Paramuribaculum sp.]|nr:hypothetical protein [Paramuribaculum sp.]